LFIKLLALIAALLMPFGMTTVPAAATEHHSASMPMKHCPEQGQQSGKAGFVECTMACSAALPAAEAGQNGPVLVVCVPTEAVAARQLHGLNPDTATPPPKRS
jgi:hypothetical protein